MFWIRCISFLLFGQAISVPASQPASAPTSQPAVSAPSATPQPPVPASPSAVAPAPARIGTRDLLPLDDNGAWLLQLARHQGHLGGRRDPRAVTLQALGLMQAATQVQPRLAEAYLWQYDLYDRIDRSQDALAALKRYVELAPDDETARLTLIRGEIDKLQTAEARAAAIRDALARPNLPRTIASDLYRRLAEYHRERGEKDEAGKAIENALRLMPTNVVARQLSYDVLGESEPLLQRVELALALVLVNPGQVNVLWEMGEMLDSLSLHREAQEWYLRAIELHTATVKSAVPADYWYELGLSYANSGDYKEALDAVSKAVAGDPRMARAKILQSHVLTKLGKPDADAPLQAVGKQYDAEYAEIVSSRNVAKAADAAWFYAFHRPDKERALKLSELAASVPNAMSLAQRSLGYAQLLDNKFTEAAATLKPLAEVDQLAAVGYARALLGLNRPPEAVKTLTEAAKLSFTGLGYEMIVDLLKRQNAQPPPRPSQDKLLEALHRFDRRVFDYYKRPGDFIRVTIELLDEPLPSLGPWRVGIRVENRGPFAITLGDGMMAQPLILFSMNIGDPQAGRFPNCTQLLLNRRPVLLPGDVIEAVTTVDVGPPREYILATASQTQAVEISALFDPVMGEKGFELGATSIAVPPLRVTRTGIPRDADSARRWMEQLNDVSMTKRFAAIDALGALLVENDLATRRQPLPARASAVQQRLAALVDSTDWPIRARALEALRWSRQPKEIVTRVSKCIEDEHFAVRVMAVRFFVAQQAQHFEQVLESLSASDPESCVRILARSYMHPG